MFPIVVDSIVVVVISVGGYGWKKIPTTTKKKLSEDSRYSGISQWQTVISHEGRVSVVLRGYNLINEIPASILWVRVMLGSINELSGGSLSATIIYWQGAPGS